MSVDSLNRPPTLLTMASSFNSSSMVTPFRLTPHNRFHLGDGLGQIFIDDLVVVFAGMFEFLRRCGHTSPNRCFLFRPPLLQAMRIRFQGSGAEKDRHTVRI